MRFQRARPISVRLSKPPALSALRPSRAPDGHAFKTKSTGFLSANSHARTENENRPTTSVSKTGQVIEVNGAPVRTEFELFLVGGGYSGWNGAPGKIRTPDPQIRSLVLYPAELPAQASLLDCRVTRRDGV